MSTERPRGTEAGADPGTDHARHGQSPAMDGSTAAAAGGALSSQTGASSLPVAAGPTFDEVYDGHFKAVWLALRRLGVWERDLDDAAHDVFIVVHRRLIDFDPSRPVRPWLLGIAARVASEFRRRSQHRHEVVSEDTDAEKDRLPQGTPAHGVRADRALDDKERRALLHRALDTLNIDRRTVLVLHDIEGHGMPEIAAALEVNINTLYARLRQARLDLKTAVLLASGDDDGASR